MIKYFLNFSNQSTGYNNSHFFSSKFSHKFFVNKNFYCNFALANTNGMAP